ncbi:MAG: DUF2098 domain-containing protein [Methanobrevibacter sp.]|nr:DUF2098 domain-containing protein [Methanobrevibacter sp.]
MQTTDARGKIIEIGSYIRYVGTGTIGKVDDLRFDQDGDWVKLEDINLWYSTDLVELVDENSVNIKDSHIKRDLDVEELKDLASELDEASLTSGGAEGGG